MLIRRIANIDALTIGALVLLPFVFMWDFVLGQSHLHYLDFTVQWLPWQKFVVDSLRRGEAPFWNPYLMLGFSQVGESQVGMFYPINILTLLIELHWRLVLVVCLHLALANVGMYCLLRRLSLSRVAAVVGAISYGLSGGMFAQVTNYVVMQCQAYLPLLVLLLVRYLETERPILLGWFALVAAVTLSISHGGTTFMLLAGVSVFFVVAAARSGHFVRHSLFYGLALAMVLAFGAIQVLPTLELRPLSERASGLLLKDVLDPRFIAGFEERLSFFFPWSLGTLRVPAHKAGFVELHQYAGAFVPALAVVAVARWRQFAAPRRTFLSAVVVLGVVATGLSLGSKFPFVNPWPLLMRVPLFSLFRIPARWGCLMTFALSVLGAFGVDALLDEKSRKWVPLAACVGLPAAAVAAAMVQEGARPVLSLLAHSLPVLVNPSNAFERSIVQPLSGLSPVVLYLLVIVPFLALHWSYGSGRLSRTRFGWAVVLLLVCDLFVFETPMNPRPNNRAFFDADPRARYFGGDKRYCRLATTERNQGAGFPMNTPAYFGIFSTFGDTPLELRQYMFIERELRHRRADVLDFLGACYEFDGRRLKERRNPAPRAFLVRDLRSARETNPIRPFLKLQGEELQRVAYLGTDDFALASRTIRGSKAPPEQAVRIERFENSRVDLDVRSSAPALLELTDMDYPGWSVQVDDREAPLLSAQGTFRSVIVPAGSHRVSFRFRPKSVYYGAALSGLSLLGFFAWVVLERRKRLRASA